MLVIVPAVVRYLILMTRERWPRWRPTAEEWDRAHRRTGEAMYRLTAHLGGAFVKLGQMVGARGDALPAELVKPLRQLHDRVPPRPFAELRSHVEAELGAPIDEVFAELAPEPLAAASLAQVHRGRLQTGEQVVLKVQYPEAHRIFPVDLGSLRFAVALAHRLNRDLDLRPLARELTEFVALELDFTREAQSTVRVREALAKVPRVRVPEVHARYSTRRILVLEYLEGTPLSAVETLRESGVDLADVANRVARLYATMIFEIGFFHGDPHPGNILVARNGDLSLLDFGLAKELPEGFAAGVARMFAYAMRGDSERAASAAADIGFVIRSEQRHEFLGLVRLLFGDYRDAHGTLAVLRDGAIEHIPHHFTLIIRVFLLLNGVSHSLVPGERVIARAMLAALAPHVAVAMKEAAAAPPAPAIAAEAS